MKKFIENGEYYILSTLFIREIPYSGDNDNAFEEISRTICEDACNLSADGSGQTSIEILRVADDACGMPIHHLITIRTHDRNEHSCTIRHSAMFNGVNTMLSRYGFVCEETSFDAYRKCIGHRNNNHIWALKKQIVQEYGVQGTYDSIPLVEDVDWNKIYSVLDGSGCKLCIQIIPSLLNPGERETIARNAAKCSQAIDGIVPNMRDKLATASSNRWNYLSQNLHKPFAEVNITVIGETTSSALVLARIRQALNLPSLKTIAIPQFYDQSFYNLPWRVSYFAKGGSGSLLDKWTTDEVAQIFRLPVQDKYFVGVKGNPFSFAPANELIPDELTNNTSESILLGKSAFSSQHISLPNDQLLLHTAIMGKSGSGKTTLMKDIIRQLHSENIPVLIMEPVKREYRDLISTMKGSKVFTVEKPLIPLLINPFYVPDGVKLGDYKNCLFSAFKAAFSLPDPLPSLFEKAISESYTRNGWTDMSMSSDGDVRVFDMVDFMRVFKKIIARSTYSAEVKGNMMSGGVFRLQSLIERCPRTFDTLHSTSVEDLLNGSVVIEMGSLEGEQKALVSALTLISILAYLKATRTSGNKLRNIILIDETHALLDQGDGVIQEERSLNNTMSVLLINTITEMRAYGVGVMFSDQSPSRVGGQLLDNVDNILSFRLSGEEANMLTRHMGSEENTVRLLSQLAAGELVLKNRFINSVLPVRHESGFAHLPHTHISDDQIFRSQIDYLWSHSKEYRPYSYCELTGCTGCRLGMRETAKKIAMKLFVSRQNQLKKPEEIAQHIIMMPKLISDNRNGLDDAGYDLLCSCASVHLLRLCALENDIGLSEATISKLLSDMKNKGGIADE